MTWEQASAWGRAQSVTVAHECPNIGAIQCSSHEALHWPKFNIEEKRQGLILLATSKPDLGLVDAQKLECSFSCLLLQFNIRYFDDSDALEANTNHVPKKEFCNLRFIVRHWRQNTCRYLPRLHLCEAWCKGDGLEMACRSFNVAPIKAQDQC